MENRKGNLDSVRSDDFASEAYQTKSIVILTLSQDNRKIFGKFGPRLMSLI